MHPHSPAYLTMGTTAWPAFRAIYLSASETQMCCLLFALPGFRTVAILGTSLFWCMPISNLFVVLFRFLCCTKLAFNRVAVMAKLFTQIYCLSPVY
jgi:hypothetical protein